jgi:aromatic ring hydroxylase
MPLRSPDAYRDGLRDSREVYVEGQRVPDVTRHAGLRVAVEHAANVFELALSSDTRKLFTSSLDGEPVSRYFQELTSIESLERRAQLIEEHTRRGRTTLNLTKAVGTDALAGLHSIASAMDHSLRTSLLEKVGRFRNHCARGDLTIAVAQTDAKGDRSQSPVQQSDPDAYLHIVERRPEGVVVCGAKAHTTMAPVVDELIVLPTRSLGPEDREYAIAFAIPIATPGLKLICGPLPKADSSAFDHPVSSRNVEIESLTVFDHVLVPWERVFMAGEWEFAGRLATTFATFHRFTSIAYKLPMVDLLLGCALLISQANGIAAAGHVRQKLAWLVQYRQILLACLRAAAKEAIPVEGGLFMPHPLYSSAGKHHFASSYHEAVQRLQDLAGGFAITAPGEADWRSPETGPWVRKYLSAAQGTSAELRLRLFHLIRDITASDFGGYNYVVTLHGEGSLQAQVLQLLHEVDLTSTEQTLATALGVNVELKLS